MVRVAPWVGLGAATAAAAVALAAVGFPSPTLFSALLVGLAFALARPQAGLELPRGVLRRRAGAWSASCSAPTCSPTR